MPFQSRCWIIAPLVFGVLSVVSCSEGESSCIGQWELDKEATATALDVALVDDTSATARLQRKIEDASESTFDEKQDQQFMQSATAGMMNAMLDSMIYDIDILDDHTFRVRADLPMTGVERYSGEWEADEQGVLLTLPNGDEREGRTIRMSLVDGKLHLVSETRAPLVFKRKGE